MMDRNRKIIFVVGNSRSGTTMMAKLLAKNNNVFTFGELHFFEQLWDNSLCSLNDNEVLLLSKRLFSIQRDGYLAPHQYDQYSNDAHLFLSVLTKKGVDMNPVNVFYNFLIYESELNGKTIACEQTPKNLLYFDEILGNFSSAYIINMTRDPRDILLSQKNRWKLKFLGLGDIPFFETIRNFINYHPFTTSAIWQSSIRNYKTYSGNNRVLNIYFEELLSNPEQVIKDACLFLQIQYNPNMLKVKQIHSSNEENSSDKVGIDKNKAGRWKLGGLNNTEIFICQRRLKKEMADHGYEIEQINPSYIMLMIYYLYFPVHLVLVIFFNFNRVKNIFSAIKRRFK